VPNDPGFLSRIERDDVVNAAIAGLTSTPKTLPPWLFYDNEGCRLFYEITKLPEYYLTRTEASLLSARSGEMIPASVRGAALIEFGASTEDKASHLLDLRGSDGERVFHTYLPIDIAQTELLEMQSRLGTTHPYLHVAPIVGDFMRPIELPETRMPRFGFFPGSTIGNLDPDAAIQFLSRINTELGPRSWLLLGADLRKDPAILLPAYNDAAGVTAAFNLNLLTRLNRDAAAQFDLTAFRHEAVWNNHQSRIEMHLISETEQTVRVAGHDIAFRRGESIHTENSYKHAPDAIVELARRGGWQRDRSWTDPAGWFGIFLFSRG
jgi:L-histidine Nalpha-methyltransferase